VTSRAHVHLRNWAEDLGWDFAVKIIPFYETKRLTLTKGQHQIEVFLASDERVMSAFRRRAPGEVGPVRIMGGQQGIITAMKALS
jgi:hypothetical protein